MAIAALPELSRGAARGLVAIVDEVSGLAPTRQLLDPALVAAAARAWSPNTIRAFLSDLKLGDRWCRGRGVVTARAFWPTWLRTSMRYRARHPPRTGYGRPRRSGATW